MTQENGQNPITGNEFEQGLRLGIQAALGDSAFGENRDRFEVFGWPDDPEEEDYVAMYLRNGYAKTIVDKPAFTTWRDEPRVEDRADREESPFESDITALSRQHNIWAYCQRVDRIAGINNHGLLLLGFDDVVGNKENWQEPLFDSSNSGLDDLNSLKPLLQLQIEDIDYGQPGSERWGKPEYYHLDLTEDIDEDSEGEGQIYKVHWSRVIDVPATRPLDDETIARPRFEAVLNNLIDIEKTLGSAAEQSYRGADYGLHINYDPEKVDPSAVEDSSVGEEFQNWYHGLQPQFTTVGGEVNTLGGEMQDPSPIVEENINEIAAETGIPKNELRGNESGTVTGAEEDSKAYFGMIEERRQQYATPHIVRELVDRLIRAGVISQPAGNGYEVNWPDLAELSEEEEAGLESDRADVVAKLSQAGIVLDREQAVDVISEGEYPEFEDTQIGNLDESNARVREQWNAQQGNDNRYNEGDTVSTPQGVGVVLEAITEGTVEGKEASDSSPLYAVAVESEREGTGFYRASEIHSTTIETDVENPEEELTNGGQTGNVDTTFDYPESWEKSSTPNRVILLKAWAGMGGTFRGCKAELGSNRLCASMKDRVTGTEDWRGGWAD